MGRMASKVWSSAAHAIGMMLGGWIHREQDAVIVYQKEEIRASREMLGGRQLGFTDAQRRRLALKARPLSHAKLWELGSLVTSDTLTRWFRKYARAKYDGYSRSSSKYGSPNQYSPPTHRPMPRPSPHARGNHHSEPADQ
jgi:hypothetical protein